MILTQALRTLARAELSVFGPERFSANPSILRFDDGRLCAVKGVNFDFERIRLSGDWQALDPRQRIDCRYKIVHLDAHLRQIACFDLDSSDVSRACGRAVDVEDLRLFRRDGAVWACGAAVARDDVFTGARWIMGAPRTRMFVGELILDRLENIHLLNSPTGAREEKNWMPAVRGARLDFIVDVAHRRHISLETALAPEAAMNVDVASWRGWSGSSALVPLDQGFLGVIHRMTRRAPRAYEHMFAFFDTELKLRRRSAPFSFEGAPAEFCCGLDISGDVVDISYGVMDKRAIVAAFPKGEVLATLCYDAAEGDLVALDVAGAPDSGEMEAHAHALARSRDALLEELRAAALRIATLERG